MDHYYQGRKLPFSNPLANALVVLVGALAIGASIVLGFIAFVALGSLILVLAAIVGIRVWWFKRKLRRQGGSAHRPTAGRPERQSTRIEIIEGEFKVVPPSERADSDRET